MVESSLEDGENLTKDHTFTKFIIKSENDGIKVTLTVWAYKNSLMAQGSSKSLEVFVQGFLLNFPDDNEDRSSTEIITLLKNFTTPGFQKESHIIDELEESNGNNVDLNDSFIIQMNDKHPKNDKSIETEYTKNFKNQEEQVNETASKITE